jgi:hypothetical protein
MESHIKLGRLFGIKIGLHYTWAEALEIIGRADVNQLPVMSNGHLEGPVSHD